MNREGISVAAGISVAGSSADDLVSVIIPIYNSERFLDEAIESVAGQTHDRWELLLVNDGSTDASPAIAQRYAERHPGKVRYLEHAARDNRGCSASRNLGIREARGKYIAFLDADDVWLPDKLRTQVALLRAHPEAAMTYGPSGWWYGWTGRPEDVARDFIQDLGVAPDTLVRPPALLALFLRNEKTVPIPASILVRRDAVQRTGVFEESFRGHPNGLYEDQPFYAKITLAEASWVTADVHCRYRQHPDAVTAVAKRARAHAPARLAFLTWLEGHLAARGVTEGEVWTFVQTELWRRRHPRISRHAARARRICNRLQGRLTSLAEQALSLQVLAWLRHRW